MVDSSKKLEQYYWMIGIVVGAIIIAILAIVFIVVPTIKSIKQVDGQLKEKKQILSVKEQKLAKLKELKVKEQELKEQSKIVYRAIPTKKEVGDVFIELSELEKGVGGSFTGTQKSDSASSTSASASSEGAASSVVDTMTYSNQVNLPNYDAFKVLLANSEKALRFVHLDHFSISGENNFSVNLTYKAYYRNPQTEAQQ